MVELKPRIKEKRWDIKREKEIIDKWKEEKIYTYTMNSKDTRPLLVIDTPPPYPSGKWHVAGAAHYSQIDMIARYFRLKGYNVVFPFYADRNGLPVEVKVEKTYNVNAHKMASTPEGRRKFIQLCSSFLDEVESELITIMERMGCSHTYWKNGTDSVKYRTMTQATFIELWKKGMIYEDERPVRWCPRCKTTLAEAEVEYEERKGYLYTVIYTLKETGEPLYVSTTRPELIAACRALAFNPEDERYRHLEGKTALAPIYGHELKILSHPQVDQTYGTGLMMICSYGDEDDVRMFKELGLEPRVIVNEDGRLTEEAGPLAGLKVDKARERIVELLEREGLLRDKKEITHKVPTCWRCHTPIQIIHRREYFLKQMEFLPELRKLIDKIEFKPPIHKRKLLDWMDSITMDWPISRDRYYGTEIPVWHCTSCGAKIIPEPGKYYRPWIDEPPFDKCPVCGASKDKLVGEKKTFDTWFDSSASMLYVTQWFYNKGFYERAKENTLRPQGYEIIRTWLYYSLLRVYQLTGRPSFKLIRISGMGLDQKGRAMHKSLGNVVDPEPILGQEGADAFRYWAAASAKLGYDYRFNPDVIRTGKLFATKLWNIARFISSFPVPGDSYELSNLDKAFLGLLDEYLERIDGGYSNLDVFDPIHLIYEFTWNFFASHYLELSKKTAYNRDGNYSEEVQRGTWYALHQILRRILIILSPIMPVVTDAIYRELYGGSVHKQLWPEKVGYEELADLARSIVKINNAIWGEKRKLGLKLVDSLPGKLCLAIEAPSDILSIMEEFHKARITVNTDCDGIEIAPGIKLLD
ncbi:MAG: valine--tRNA ligase [Desulfurococcales archaeon]|nr:valine--tRNA ligase [Desulfurococcales archaeon]